MLSTYFLASRLLIEQAFTLFVAKWGLSFLGGTLGKVLSFLIALPVALLASEGFLILEFSRIDRKVGKERERYVEAIDKLQGAGKLSKEEKAKIIAEVKAATKEFITVRQYLK